MNTFRADLHIHSVLSPCGGLDMSPGNIVRFAVEKKLDIIGLTDHNSTKHCRLVKKFGEQAGLFVLCGAEITTKEEVHCLVFFEDEESLADFQVFIDEHLPVFPNDVEKFGYQVIVDENEMILEEEDRLLISALDIGIEPIEKKVHELNGIFIPAHIDRYSNSIFSQLGFIPPGLKYEALGITRYAKVDEVREKFGIRDGISIVKSSDAHFTPDIGSGFSVFEIMEPVFDEIRMALKNENNRKVTPK
jgi:3',5'-nucleoside bisphosphate phosphatase